MTYRKEIITRLTALVLSLSMMTTAYAVKPNEVTEPLENTGTTAVTLTVLDSGGDGEGPGTGGDEGFIIATVPAELPIVMDLQGKITVPNDAKIINHSDESNIEIINIDTIMGDGWEIADFRDDFKSKQENSKELGLRLRGDELSTDGSFNLTDGNWVVAKDEGVLQLQMAAKLPKQSETSRTQIATVQFTLDLTNKEASIDKPVIPEEPEEQSTITNDWGKDRVLKSSVTPVVISYDSTLADVRIVSVESNSPSVTVEKSKQKRSLGNPGEEVWNVKAVSKGAATITAELSTGDTTSFDVMVYELELDDGGTVTVPEIPNKGEGDKLITGDLVIDIPIQTPDGKDKITVTPTIPDGTVLEEGDNTIDTTVTVDGVTINITINITIQSSNPSDGLHQSIEDAQAMGFTFSSYEDGLQIDSFENKQFKSEINVPEQIGDFKVLKINSEVFKGKTNIKKVTLPGTITAIERSSFIGCTNLESVIIPDGVKSIDESAFEDCSRLASVYLPDSVTNLGKYAFRDCTGLKSLNIPRNLTSVYPTALYKAGAEDSVLTVCRNPDDNKLGYAHEFDNMQFEHIVFTDGVTEIGERVFSNNDIIKSVTLPDGLTSIGLSAFGYCDNLSSVTIPESVTYIGESAFYNIPQIYYNGSAEGAPWGALKLN